METTLKTLGLGVGGKSEDLAAGEWRRHWRLSIGGVETSTET